VGVVYLWGFYYGLGAFHAYEAFGASRELCKSVGSGRHVKNLTSRVQWATSTSQYECSGRVWFFEWELT